jgi:hypothetical protein
MRIVVIQNASKAVWVSPVHRNHFSQEVSDRAMAMAVHLPLAQRLRTSRALLSHLHTSARRDASSIIIDTHNKKFPRY